MTAHDREPAPHRRSRRGVVGVAVAIAAIAGGGAAIAATTLSSPQAASDAIISDAAERLGVEPEALNDALEQAYEARIDEQVQAGELSQEHADALKQRLESGDVPLVGGPGLRGPGGFFEKGPGHHGRLELRVLVDLQAAATYLGLSAEDLKTKLGDGQSLADVVAATPGKTVEGLKQALTNAATKALDERVAAGDLTEEQKAEILQGLSTRLDGAIEGTFERGGPGRHGPGFGPAFGGRILGGLDAAATYLGLSLEELGTQLRAGDSLAEIATAQGKTADGLKQAMTDAITKELDERVASGGLTEAEKARILEDLPARLDEQLNASGERKGFFFRHHGDDELPAPDGAMPEGTTPGSTPQDSGPTTTTASLSI